MNKFIKIHLVFEHPTTQVYYVCHKASHINLGKVKIIHELNMEMPFKYKYRGVDLKDHEYEGNFQVYEAVFDDGSNEKFITLEDFNGV